MKKREKKIEKIKYTAKRIIWECQKNGYNKIGISSSLEKNPMSAEILEVLKQQGEKSGHNLQIVELPSINHYADALETARQCDAIILIERYLYSTYKELDKAVELAKNAEVNILGVIGEK